MLLFEGIAFRSLLVILKIFFNSESILIKHTKSSLHPMIRKLSKKFNTQTAQLVRTQRQNTQLLAINNSLSQTHTEIGLLLTERQESEGDREIVTEVRALLDKNNAALSEIVVEADQGVKIIIGLHLVLISENLTHSIFWLDYMFFDFTHMLCTLLYCI